MQGTPDQVLQKIADSTHVTDEILFKTEIPPSTVEGRREFLGIIHFGEKHFKLVCEPYNLPRSGRTVCQGHVEGGPLGATIVCWVRPGATELFYWSIMAVLTIVVIRNAGGYTESEGYKLLWGFIGFLAIIAFVTFFAVMEFKKKFLKIL